MTKEQITEMKTIQAIVDQSTFETEIEYCGREYRTYIWNTTKTDGTEASMRVIIGEKGWPLCSATMDINDCIRLCAV